jgi:hypothetical protein
MISQKCDRLRGDAFRIADAIGNPHTMEAAAGDEESAMP